MLPTPSLAQTSDIAFNFMAFESADIPIVIEQIFINGNSDFLEKAGEYGWSGNGTKDNPLIIENMNFSKNANMFSVSNTDLFFRFSKNHLNGLVRGWCAIVLYNVENAILVDNHIENAAVGVHAIKIRNSFIVNNHVINSGVGVTIENHSQNNTISNNFFEDLIECGIYSIGYSYDNIFSDNEITGGWEGITIARDSDNNTIRNNQIYQCENYGVWLMTKNNSVIDNDIHSITGCGISIWTSNNAVIGNLVYNNSECGIELKNASNRTIIRNNTILQNGSWGLLVESGSNSIIEQNDFIENREIDQVCDNGYDNIFSGNYWHFWIGEDLNSDNVIDTSYIVNGSANSIDRFPALNPNTPIPDWYVYCPVSSSCTSYEDIESSALMIPLVIFMCLSIAIIMALIISFRKSREL